MPPLGRDLARRPLSALVVSLGLHWPAVAVWAREPAERDLWLLEDIRLVSEGRLDEVPTFLAALPDRVFRPVSTLKVNVRTLWRLDVAAGQFPYDEVLHAFKCIELTFDVRLGP